jgi:hypothetical protein
MGLILALDKLLSPTPCQGVCGAALLNMTFSMANLSDPRLPSSVSSRISIPDGD